MKLETIVKEIENRIKYLHKKKEQLIILEMSIEERHRREQKYNSELDKLTLMLHYSK